MGSVALEGFGSGGAALNFKVVPGLTQPGAATENTIWVKTESMTGWIIDANQPEELTEGMVWISVGTESAVEFNALKKNGLKVYPLSAKQYVNGALENVLAKSYQNGTWNDWFDGVLYDAGNQCEDITGGWERNSAMNFNGAANTGTVTFNASNVYLVSPKSTSAIISTKNKVYIDTSRFVKIKFDISVHGYAGNDGYGIISEHGNVYKDFVASVASSISVGSSGTVEVNISNVPSGYYYVYAGVSSERQRYVYKIWLE